MTTGCGHRERTLGSGDDGAEVGETSDRFVGELAQTLLQRRSRDRSGGRTEGPQARVQPSSVPARAVCPRRGERVARNALGGVAEVLGDASRPTPPCRNLIPLPHPRASLHRAPLDRPPSQRAHAILLASHRALLLGEPEVPASLPFGLRRHGLSVSGSSGCVQVAAPVLPSVAIGLCRGFYKTRRPHRRIEASARSGLELADPTSRLLSSPRGSP